MRKFLFFLFFIIGSKCLGADMPVVYQLPSYSRGDSFIVSRGRYEDIRVDSNKDGLVDYWLLRSGNLTIEQVFFSPKNSSIRFTNIAGGIVRVIEYQKRDRKWNLSRLEKRDLRYFNGFGKKDPGLCLPKEKIEVELAKLTSSTVDEVLDQSVAKIVDSSCNDLFDRKQKRDFLNAIQSALNTDKSLLLKCLGDPEKKRKLYSSFSDDKNKIDLELEAIKTQYQSLCLTALNSPEVYAKKITCKSIDGNKNKAQVSENGEIIFYKGKDTKEGDYSPRSIEQLFTHEFVHPMGVTNENAMNNLLGTCFDLPERPVIVGSLKTMPPPPTSSTEIVHNNVAPNQATVIPKEWAETALSAPSQQELSRSFNDQQTAAIQYNQNPEGASEKAYQESYRETAPIRSRATQIMAAFGGIQPANAATLAGGVSGGEIGNGGGVSSSRSPASTVLKNAAKKASSTSDEYRVVEEYTTDPDSFRVGAKSTSTKTSGTDSLTRVSSKPATADTVTDTGANAAANLSSGGELGNVPTEGSGNASAPSSGGGRGIASVGGGGSGGSRNLSSVRGASGNSKSFTKNEALNILVNDDYEAAKRQLSNPAFTSSLKKNGITILDRTGQPVLDKRGNPVSAERGNTVLLDRGDRFVRQK